MVRDGLPVCLADRKLNQNGKDAAAILAVHASPADRETGGQKAVQREKDGHRKSRDRLTFLVARPGGFEPPAKSLEGSCSIHLSYERVLSL